MVLDGSTYIILDPRPSVCFGGCCSSRSAWGRKLRKEPPPRAPAPGRWPGVTQRDPQGTEPGGGQVWMCSGPPQWTGGAWKTGSHSTGPIPLSLQYWQVECHHFPRILTPTVSSLPSNWQLQCPPLPPILKEALSSAPFNICLHSVLPFLQYRQLY